MNNVPQFVVYSVEHALLIRKSVMGACRIMCEMYAVSVKMDFVNA